MYTYPFRIMSGMRLIHLLNAGESNNIKNEQSLGRDDTYLVRL